MRAIPTLKISISGVRGVIGQSLTPSLLTRFAQAFGTHTGAGTIVIGRDPRTSGEMVKHAVIAGILSSGSRVVDIGTRLFEVCLEGIWVFGLRSLYLVFCTLYFGYTSCTLYWMWI